VSGMAETSGTTMRRVKVGVNGGEDEEEGDEVSTHSGERKECGSAKPSWVAMW